MRFESLALENFRRFEQVSIDFAPGINLILGANGAGKTTLLEAAFVLSYGRSFRRGSSKALARTDGGPLRIVGRLSSEKRPLTLLGLERREEGWTARIDGAAAASLNELLRRCAVCCFEPGSHELIAGGAELRRSFIDWGVFHVEHEFLDQWRRYSRALKHANALTRRQTTLDQLTPWFLAMERVAGPIAHHRESYLHAWRRHFIEECARLLPELGEVEVGFDPGWDLGRPLSQVLIEQWERDRQRGHISRGAHRADFSLSFRKVPRREQLSRGQEKLVALAAVLSQAALFGESRGEWPVLLFDDLPSELDLEHQTQLLDRLQALSAQVIVTATHLSPPLERMAEKRVFHVEPDGSVTSSAREGSRPS